MLKYLLVALISTPVFASPVGYVKTMDDAKKLATGTTDIVVLHHGSGWNDTGRYLKRLWMSNNFKKVAPKIVQLEDLPTTVNELTKSDRETLEAESKRTGKGMDRLIGEFLNRGKKNQFKRIMNYPALSLFDGKGNYVATVEGLDKMSPGKLASEISALRKIREKRDFYWKKADNAKTSQQVELIEKGIRCVTEYVSEDQKQRRRKPYLNYIFTKYDELKKLDPEDKQGYLRAFALEPFHYIYKSKSYFDFGEKKLKSESVLRESLAKINKELKDRRNRVLSPIQRQALYVVKYNITKHLDQKEAEKTLLVGAKLAPTTVLGEGLSGKYLINYGPASVRIGWKDRHCKEKTWLFGKDPVMEKMTNYISKPGVYTVTFKVRGGNFAVQGVSLKKGGFVLASDSGVKRLGRGESATYKLVVKKLAKNMTLEVNLGGNFKGHGNISIKPYNKRHDLSDIEALL